MSDGGPKPRVRKNPSPKYSRSLEYGVAMLESFSSEEQELGIAEMAVRVGLSRSTTHRYAVTLVALGYLEQDSKRKYRLTGRAGIPGAAAISAIRKSVRARGVLEELRDETGYTVSMGVLDRGRVVYVYRLFGHRPGQHAVDRELGVGASVPLYCTALGKVLLANVSEAERRKLLDGLNLIPHGPRSIMERDQLAAELERISLGQAVISDEELVDGARSIAVLVPQSHGALPLAIELTVPSSAYTVAQLARRLGPRIKRAAKLIAED